ncbi:MAG TPA: hypothetical protein VGI64_09090 [Streptosporangiaceae bacterium]
MSAEVPAPRAGRSQPAMPGRHAAPSEPGADGSAGPGSGAEGTGWPAPGADGTSRVAPAAGTTRPAPAAGGIRPDRGTGESPAPRWWTPAGLGGLVSRNPLFTAALALGVLVRVIAMAGFAPAMLIRLDSFIYLTDVHRSVPDPDNPNGYPFLLWLLRPFHSLALVAGLQAVMGLVVAGLVYTTLRRYGVPGWAGTLAALPVLLDPRELFIEHAIMADTLALLLMIAAFAVLLSRAAPSVWRSATAGLLMGLAALARPTVLPLIVLLALFLLIRRVGWRRAAVALGAGILPVAAYAGWFYSSYSAVNLTNSNGLFLWARTMSFADCSVIKPPPRLTALCPQNNPASKHLLRPDPASWSTLPRQQTAQTFLWSRKDWAWQPAPAAGAYQQPTTAFTVAKNKRAQEFALRAIKAQPLGYARVVAEGVATVFVRSDHEWRTPTVQPRSPRQVNGTLNYELSAVRSYTGGTAGLQPYINAQLGTRLRQPFARLFGQYQRVVFLPGVLLAAIFAAGLGGLLLRRRAIATAALLWVSAVVVLVLPIAENQENYRYALPAVPLACMAAALIFARRNSAGQDDAAGAAESPERPADPHAAA